MKLRNLLLASVLFSLTSIVSAAVTYDTNGGTYWNQKEESNTKWHVTVSSATRNSAQLDFLNKSDFSYSYQYGLYSLSKYNSLVAEASNGQINSLNAEDWTEGENLWTLSVGKTTDVVLTENVGFWKIVTITEPSTGDGEAISTSHLTFSKTGDDLDKFPKLNEYNVYAKGITQDVKITFGSPLPAPVVTLLIAFAFGGAFMLYRNRKQAKA